MQLVLRNTLFVAALLLIAGLGFGQIPNAGFETWANGNPASWKTNNGLYTFVTQSASAHGGSSGAQGAVVNVGAFNMSASLSSVDNANNGFPITQRYASLRGFYKFTSVNSDFFMVSYLAQTGSSGVGAGSFVETGTQSVFKEFVADILYPGPGVPDNAVITFSINHGGGFPSIGSTFVVDDLTFGPATGVDDNPAGSPGGYRLEQNYPNPFNPTTNIVYDVPQQSHVTLVVLDLLGQEVGVVVNQVQSAGRYKAVFNASRLSSGVYYYRLSAGNSVLTNRMLLLR